MNIFGKTVSKLGAFVLGISLLAACTTQYDGEVEGEYASDGTVTEVALDSSATVCANWSAFYAYAYIDGGSGEPLGSWPGTAMSAVSDEAGIYAVTMDALGADVTYKLIYTDNAGNQFDAGSFVKGDSKLYTADGAWTDWHWENTASDNTQEEEAEPVENSEQGEDDADTEPVLPHYLRGGDGIGGDAQELTYTDTADGKQAVFTWTAGASSWGAGDGNIAFKLTEYDDWNQHDGSTAYGGITWSGTAYRTEIAVGADYTALKKCLTDEEASAADNIIGTGFTVGTSYTMTINVTNDGVLSIKIEETN